MQLNDICILYYYIQWDVLREPIREILEFGGCTDPDVPLIYSYDNREMEEDNAAEARDAEMAFAHS